MTKKSCRPFVLLTLLLTLAACSPATPAASTPVTISYATPDQRMSIPTVGFGTVLGAQGRSVLLYSRPDLRATASGSVLTGQTGKIIGLDATGAWALIDFKNQIGWIPLQQLASTIAR